MNAPITTRQVFLVETSRLTSGRWCHDKDRMIGEGDIHGSYSADTIGQDGTVRRPFKWQNGLCVCTSIHNFEAAYHCEAYRLVPRLHFKGTPVTYQEAAMSSSARRKSGMGFYHGIHVKRAGTNFVLVGPPMHFRPNETEQLSLP